MNRLRLWWEQKMLWKRFGFHRCEMCNEISFVQHEVGNGYWTCGSNTCRNLAVQATHQDFEIEQEEQLRKRLEHELY